MSKEYSAKRYFIAQFRRNINNENKILVHKLFPGTRELLSDYIQMHNDILENIENDKFKKARLDLINGMEFFFRKSILYNHDLYKIEIETLINNISLIIKASRDKENNKEILTYTKIYNICTSFLKKLNKDNIYEYIICNIKCSTNFDEIDKLVNEFISELLYDGYSLKYLSEWYKQEITSEKNINSDNIDYVIDKFMTLRKNKEKFTYYLSLNNDCGEERYIDLNAKLKRVYEDELEFIDKENQKKVSNFIRQGNNTIIYKIDVESMDIYSGLDMIQRSFNSYFQIINSLLEEKNNKIILNNKCIVKSSDKLYRKLRIESYDENTLFSSMENREKQEIEDFIKYRDTVYETMENIDEISNIQRAINIVKSQKEQSQENRLINLWSVLEYILTFNDGGSIISNVKEVIPKVVCLYAIKEKINIFWQQLYKYNGSNIEIVNRFINECVKENEEYQYDLNRVIDFIDREGEHIVSKFEFNSILQRSIAEIGYLLNSKEGRTKYIKNLYKETEYDLSRIYRTRNILIHSSKRELFNIDYKSLRLHKYNSHILAIIIYYKTKNPHLTITEILSSIEHTYNEYERNIGTDNFDKIQICKPRYLFI